MIITETTNKIYEDYQSFTTLYKANVLNIHLWRAAFTFTEARELWVHARTSKDSQLIHTF